MKMNDPIISPEDLFRRLEAGPSPVLLDARIDPGGDAFEAGRIAGAQRVDLEEDLTGTPVYLRQEVVIPFLQSRTLFAE